MLITGRAKGTDRPSKVLSPLGDSALPTGGRDERNGHVGVGRTAAAPPFVAGGRKVRAPQDKVLGNAQSRRREGKCHRKQTAPEYRPRAVHSGVRVKR